MRRRRDKPPREKPKKPPQKSFTGRNARRLARPIPSPLTARRGVCHVD